MAIAHAKIYVASSWRNEMQQRVVAALREVPGAEVYDYRNPVPGNSGFHWSEVDPQWKSWTPAEFRSALQSSRIAQDGFELDMGALAACDICVLVLPCGRSAHLEAGFAAGSGAVTIVLLAPGEPELMYLMADYICVEIEEVVSVVSVRIKQRRLSAAGRKGRA